MRTTTWCTKSRRHNIYYHIPLCFLLFLQFLALSHILSQRERVRDTFNSSLLWFFSLRHLKFTFVCRFTVVPVVKYVLHYFPVMYYRTVHHHNHYAHKQKCSPNQRDNFSYNSDKMLFLSYSSFSLGICATSHFRVIPIQHFPPSENLSSHFTLCIPTCMHACIHKITHTLFCNGT